MMDKDLLIGSTGAEMHGLINKLVTLPDKKVRAKASLATAKGQLDEAKGELDIYESVLAATISEEVNPLNGKPRHPNAEARAAELRRRSSEDETAHELRGTLAEAKRTADNARFELERLDDEFAATMASIHGIASINNLMASIYALPA